MELVLGLVLFLAAVALSSLWRGGKLQTQQAIALAFVMVMVGAAAALLAETPFGIGNGRVPDVIGLDACDATAAITERGLRWRWRNERGSHANAIEYEPRASPSCKVDPIDGQAPQPGTKLREGDVVAIETPCTRERNCG